MKALINASRVGLPLAIVTESPPACPEVNMRSQAGRDYHTCLFGCTCSSNVGQISAKGNLETLHLHSSPWSMISVALS